ncbi:MAG: YHS domain-containing protein [Candidatus Limnocylindrales bacterium]
MLDLRLTSEARGDTAIVAGYACPCGCTPAVTYERGAAVATEGCCCGNQFAVGPDAPAHVHAPSGYELRTESVASPWGETVPVAWAIGPSTHPETHDDSSHDHGHEHGTDEHEANPTALDPVCGMTVEPPAARAKGLHSPYQGRDYFFCGKGCKLEFDDDPEKYLDPAYVPSM